MEYPEHLSKYCSFLEAIKSQTAERLGIQNLPSPDQLANMMFVAINIIDPCRDFIGGPLFISSFLRVHLLNKAIGGSSTSQHRDGKAVDLDCDVYGVSSNKILFDFIRAELEFDQLIWEFGSKENPAWVHVSHAVDGRNRKEVLRAHRENGYTQYVPFDLY